MVHGRYCRMLTSEPRVSFATAYRRLAPRSGRYLDREAPDPNLDPLLVAPHVKASRSNVARLAAATRPRATLPLHQAKLSGLESILDLGQKPTAVDLAATLGHVHGLDRLNAVLNQFRNRPANRLQDVVYSGTLTNILSAARKGWITRIHQILHDQPVAHNSSSLLEAVGGARQGSQESHLSAALAVLERMGLIKKLPAEGRDGFYYLHACHAKSPASVPVWNLDWNVLNELKAGEKNMGDLTRLRERFGRDFGSSGGLGGENAIKLSFLRLKKAGLVQIQGLNTNRLSARLSPQGTGLLRIQRKKKHLIEPLRKALLGMPRAQGELLETQKRRLNRISRALNYLLVRREWEAAGKPFWGPESLKSRLERMGAGVVKIRSSIRGGKKTWKGIKIKELQEVYLPLIAAGSEEAGNLLREIIEKEKRLRDSKTPKTS